MVKDTGRRDSAGLEDMDAFFSPAVEKSPRKGLSPRGKLPPYKTKFQRAIQSDDSVPMSGTSSNSNIRFFLKAGSIRDPKEVLASRKSLLAQRIAFIKFILTLRPHTTKNTPKISSRTNSNPEAE
jgi:hypothetical protein